MGPIVSALNRELVAHGLVDELIVIDDQSTDRTGVIADAAGATVVSSSEILPEVTGPGKGQALWKSLYASTGDVIVWCDADIRNFSCHFVTGLLGPLLSDHDHGEVSFVKGHYSRPGNDGGAGGRVTELVARPLLSMLFPHLAETIQPLSGEFGGRRELLERLRFTPGYGVDIGLLLDVAESVGTGGIMQVDLGRRVHRNRTLDELGPQATAVAAAILRRADPMLLDDHTLLLRPDAEPVDVDFTELPPLSSRREGQLAGLTPRLNVG